MKSVLLALVSLLLTAQTPATRNVILTWVASVSTGVVGYNVYRSASPTGPFGSPLNGTTPVNGLTYTDSTAEIGQTYSYVATAVAQPCTPGGGSAPCGESPYSAPSTLTVPPKPAVVVTVTIAVP